MPKIPLLLLLFLVLGKTSAQTLQLSPPQTTSPRLFDLPGLAIKFDFRLQGAQIRFTTDGTEPIANSPIYISPIKATGPVVLKAKAFKSGFLPSETTTVQVLPYQSFYFDSIGVAPAPKKYLANGWKTLCDQHLGDENFMQNWLGFDSTAIILELFFSKKRPVSNLAIGFLRQQKAWIFLPTAIVVYDKKGNLLATQRLPDEAASLPDSMEIISLKFPKHRHKSLIVKLIAQKQLPTWHPGAGQQGWVFLDEIMAW